VDTSVEVPTKLDPTHNCILAPIHENELKGNHVDRIYPEGITHGCLDDDDADAYSLLHEAGMG
jgi:hypothetical protein